METSQGQYNLFYNSHNRKLHGDKEITIETAGKYISVDILGVDNVDL